MRPPLALGLALALLAAGCGGRAGSPASIVRAWSKALNAGENERAADLFARDATIVAGDLVRRLRTHAQAVAFNAGLPCSGRLLDLSGSGGDLTATFVLGDRPGGDCAGLGERAAIVFRVRDGKIVLWHQVGAPPERESA